VRRRHRSSRFRILYFSEVLPSTEIGGEAVSFDTHEGDLGTWAR
jgi:hypothetical protein